MGYENDWCLHVIIINHVQVVPETRNGVTWKTQVSYCCTEDNCNKMSVLYDYIAELDPSNLPPICTFFFCFSCVCLYNAYIYNTAGTHLYQ